MSEPTPGQPQAGGLEGQSGNSPVQFDSTMSTKAGQPRDYFAEQNAQRAEKKQKVAKVQKKVIIISVIIALIAIIAAVIVVPRIWNQDTALGDDDSELSGVQQLDDKATGAYAPTYSMGEDGNVVVEGDLSAAEGTFTAALNNPANKEKLDTIYVAQMVFYESLSDNQRIVEVAAQVDPSKLNLAEKIKFYNLTYLAYSALGDKSQAQHYYNLMREATRNVTGIGG